MSSLTYQKHCCLHLKGTYTIPRCQLESKPESGSRKPSPHSGEEATGPDDDEESMDWWTKYFASVDNMIDVSKVRLG